MRIVVPAGKASAALNSVSRQSKSPILYPNELVEAIQVDGFECNCRVEEVVERILEGQNLTISRTDFDVYVISAASPPTNSGVGNLNSSNKNALIAGAASVAIIGAGSASAQDQATTNTSDQVTASVLDDSVENSSDSRILQTVTVEARRRVENIQDVPGSLSAISDKDLQDAGITTLTDIQYLSPGLVIQEGVDDNTARFFVRGIGTATPTVGIEPSVPLYVDDVYTPSGLGSNIDLFALDRVEVLRGPQGTLYGRNAFGGAIKVYTRELGNESEGYVSVTGGTASRRDVKAEFSGPIIEDKLFFSVGAAKLMRDGYQTGAFTNADLWADDTEAFRFKLQAQPTDGVRLSATYDFTEIDAPAKQPKITNIGAFEFNGGVQALFPNAVPNNPQLSNDPDIIDSEVTANSGVETEGFAFTADLDLTENLSAKYIGATRRMSNERIFDIDGTATPFLTVAEDFRVEGTSHELQLQYAGDRLSATGGVFYYEEETDSTSLTPVQNFFTFLDDPTNPASTLLTDPEGRMTATDIANQAVGLRQDTESVAIYANVSYEIAPDLNVSVGLRYTEDEKTQIAPAPGPVFVGGALDRLSGTFPNVFNIPAGATLLDPAFGGFDQTPTSDEYSEVTPEFVVDYKLNEDTLLYGSYKRGFQSGQLFPFASAVPGSAVSTDAQTVDSFEVGFKHTLSNGRGLINGAAYYYDFNDLIVSVNTPVPITVSATGFAGVPANAGAARTYGFELDGQYALTDNFIVSGDLAYTDFEVTEVITADGNGGFTNIADTFLQTYTLVPEIQARIGAEYFMPVAEGEARLFTNIAYRDEIGVNAANAAESSGIGLVVDNPVTNEFFTSDAFTNVIAGVSWESSDEVWRIDLSGQNLLDERRPVAAIAVVPEFLGAIRQFNAPRTWQVSLTRSF